ncbi:GNAT family N-acetyltransferase [Metabacillus sp. HB246100]
MYIKLLTPLDAKEYGELRLEALRHQPEAFLMTYEEVVDKENIIDIYRGELMCENRLTYGAFNYKGDLLGIGTLQLGRQTKIKHKANVLAMYVSESGRGLGIGKRLLKEIILKARSFQIEQLHLTVVSDNDRAKRLYSTMGFKVYGLEERALKLGDRYWDEEHMVLYI